MKLIAIMNVKGGVGKTMTACNMAHILAETYKQRVLLVDADPQGNATAFFNRAAQDGGLTDLLTGLATCYDEVVQDTDYERLQLIGCDSSLFDVDLRPDQHCVDPRRVISDLRDALQRTMPAILSWSIVRPPLPFRPSPPWRLPMA